MIVAPPAHSLEPAEEICALIEVLHQADRRLEELLGGEVDSVTAIDGRTMLLRRAQGDLRVSDSARQAAILGALPAAIALLDVRGVIVSVNDAWRGMDDANGLYGPGHALTQNYLDICDRAVSSADAQLVAAGIRSVLKGGEPSFSMEYSCPSQGRPCWFLLTVTPLAGNPPNAVVVMHVNITERKRTETALQESEAEFRTLAAAMPQIVWIKRPDGHVTYFNQQWLDYAGLTLQESLGHEWHKRFHPDDAERATAVWQHAAETGVAYSVECRLRRADGAHCWWLLRGVPLKDGDGTVLKWIGTCTDIDELKQAELEISRTNHDLQRQQTELRVLFDLMPALVWFKDTQNNILRVNQRAADVAGKTVAQIEGRHSAENYPVNVAGYYADDLEVIRSGTPKLGIVETVHDAHGNVVWIETDKVPYRDADGKVVGIVVMAQDITERRRADMEITRTNRELQRQQTELRVLFDLMPAMIWFKDTDDNILRVNQRAADMTRRTIAEIEGNHSVDVYPALSEQLRLEDEEVIRTGVPMLGIVQAVTDPEGNEIWIERDKVPYRDEAGKVIGIVATAQDVTQRKRDQDALRELNADLEVRVRARTAELNLARDEAEQANRAKSAFLATMSHEIRTPMNGVIGMIEVLHQTSLQGYQVEMIDLIRDSAFSLLQIIEDILDFSKIEAGKLELVNEPMHLADMVEKACGMLDHLALKRNVRMTMFVDPAIPRTLMGDQSRLRQVLINLTGNAIKFSGGREDPGRVSVRMVLAGRGANALTVEMIVADDGIGIDAATLPLLFAPFSQADASTTRRFGGSGLGLAISRMLVDLMHGTISVESTVGRGSTFTVRVPLTAVEGAGDDTGPVTSVNGLRCRIVSRELPLADDLAAYLARGGVVVERSVDLAAAAASERAPGMTLWLIPPGQATPGIDELRVMSPRNHDAETRFILLEWGKRRRPRVKAADLVIVDADTLFRRTLFRVLALASGRVTGEFSNEELGTEAGEPAPSRYEALRQGRLILVAEDNETNRIVILRQLEVMGLMADVAVNGQDALTRWRAGDYALLLTDLHMPQMDGYALARAIRAEEGPGPRMPIIALTANALRDEELRCLAAGMDAYLSKPVRLAQLKASIESWLGPVTPAAEPLGALRAAVAATPPADLDHLVALVGDDPAVIHEVLQAFRDSAALSSAALTEAIVVDSARGAAEAAHRLKSAARAVGALRVGDLCAEIERAAQAQATGELKALLPLFHAELSAVLRFLDSR